MTWITLFLIRTNLSQRVIDLAAMSAAVSFSPLRFLAVVKNCFNRSYFTQRRKARNEKIFAPLRLCVKLFNQKKKSVNIHPIRVIRVPLAHFPLSLLSVHSLNS